MSEADIANVQTGRRGQVAKIDEAIAAAENLSRMKMGQHVSGLLPEQQSELVPLLKEIRDGLYLMSSGVPHGGPN